MSQPIPLSILLPTFNGGPYLAIAVESIASQLIPGDELLVQDGASTDGSVSALIEQYRDASWLKVVSEPDKGQSDALQKALDRATHTYMMWLNADDIVYPGGLDAVRRGLADGPDLLCGRSTIFVNSGRVVRTYTPRPVTRRALLGRGADLFTGSLAFRTQLVRDVGGFDISFQYGMDVDLMARIVESDPTIAYVPEVIGGLRWHEDSKGGSVLWPIVHAGARVRYAHARNLRERAIATSALAAYFVAGLVQPIRHSAPYSAIRARLRKKAKTPAA